MLDKFYNLFSNSYIQTFDDEKKGRKELVTMFPFSEFNQRKEELKRLNNKGAGIFFTPNPCTGGRSESNITQINWIYVDIDGYPKQDSLRTLLKAPIRPHIIVESKNSPHAYWRVKTTLKQFRGLVDRLIFYFDSDPAISSINEVLRLPGFYHVKNRQSPYLVEVKHFFDNPEYDIEDMLEAYPPKEEQTKSRYNLQDGDLDVIKEIPILQVCGWLGLDVRKNQIFENNEGTSAMINVKGNYINRFSGRPPSGTTIDLVMCYNKCDAATAIAWLKDKAGIVKRSAKEIAKMIVKPTKTKKLDKYFSWGTDELTASFAPIKPGMYCLIGAGYGVGKTTFCLHLAQENALLGHKVLYLSLEMDKEELFDYLARKYAGWTIPEEIYHQVPERKTLAYEARRKELEEMENITFLGIKGGTDVTWEVLRELMDGDYDLIIVDNFNQIVKSPKVNQYDHENNLSKNFLAYAAEKQTALIVVHHYSQGGAKENVKTGYSLSGSARIKNDATRIVLLDRKRQSSDEDAQELTGKEKAAMKVTLDKGRAYDNWITKYIYFRQGKFYDKYLEDATFKEWIT